MKRVYLFIVTCLLALGPILGSVQEDKRDSIISLTSSQEVLDERMSYFLHRSSRSRPLPVKQRVAETVKVEKKKRKVVDDFDRLAKCESGMRPRALNRTGKFRGAFQFSLRTWHWIGMKGDPIDYSYAYQKRAAKKLYRLEGSAPWPECGRYLK